MNDITPNAVLERDESALTVPQPVFVPLASQSCAQVCGALAIAQGAFRAPKKTKEATVQGTTARGQPYSYKFKYAPLEEIVEAVKEGLAANGLARHQYLVSRAGQPIIRTIIWHASGEWLASDYPIHPTKEGAQGFASGVTYARRYGLSLALGLAPEDDDDGNMAEGNLATFDERNRGEVPRATKAPQVKPLPPEPAHHPETGEAGPHLIPVLQSKQGRADWLDWGGKLVAALAAAETREEGEAWLEKCQAALDNCGRDAPKVYERIQANIQAMRERLPDFIEAQ